MNIRPIMTGLECKKPQTFGNRADDTHAILLDKIKEDNKKHNELTQKMNNIEEMINKQNDFIYNATRALSLQQCVFANILKPELYSKEKPLNGTEGYYRTVTTLDEARAGKEISDYGMRHF